jgi:hypothetical protein
MHARSAQSFADYFKIKIVLLNTTYNLYVIAFLYKNNFRHKTIILGNDCFLFYLLPSCLLTYYIIYVIFFRLYCYSRLYSYKGVRVKLPIFQARLIGSTLVAHAKTGSEPVTALSCCRIWNSLNDNSA